MRTLVAACALLGGCALVQPPKPAEAPLGPGEVRSARTARDALAVGESTRDEVRAALGQATVVDFASGYEVWVYRERPPEKDKPAAGTELVLLFAPSGILSKARVR